MNVEVDIHGLTSFGLISSIARSQKAFQKMLSFCLGHHGLTLSEWQVIGLLSNAPQSPTTLAKACTLSTPQISVLISEIKQRHTGIIMDVPHDTDARSKVYMLTNEGRLFATEVEQKLQSCIHREITKKVTPNDLQTYLDVTEFIGENVRHV